LANSPTVRGDHMHLGEYSQNIKSAGLSPRLKSSRLPMISKSQNFVKFENWLIRSTSSAYFVQ